MQSSPAFVRSPEGNGGVEWFFKTLKENFLLARSFESIEELRQALIALKDFYYNSWLMYKYENKMSAAIRNQHIPPMKSAA